MTIGQHTQISKGLGLSGDSQRRTRGIYLHTQARCPRHRRTNLATQSERTSPLIVSPAGTGGCKVQLAGRIANVTVPAAAKSVCRSAKYPMPLRIRSTSSSNNKAMVALMACMDGMTYFRIDGEAWAWWEAGPRCVEGYVDENSMEWYDQIPGVTVLL